MTNAQWGEFFRLKLEELDREIEREKANNNNSIVLYGLRQKRSAYQECLTQWERSVW